jgi:hypothetical protein
VLFIPDLDPDSLPIPVPRFRIPDPGAKKAPDPGFRIRIRNTANKSIAPWLYLQDVKIIHRKMLLKVLKRKEVFSEKNCWPLLDARFRAKSKSSRIRAKSGFF